MQLKTLLFISCFLFSFWGATSYAQDKEKHENLGPNINSSADELTFLISASGKTAYWVRDAHPDNYSSQDVWCSYVDASGQWAPAMHPTKPLNTREHNSGVFAISTDENQLLIRGAYVDGEFEGRGISMVSRNKKGEWDDPQKLDIANYSKYAAGKWSSVCLSADGKTLLFSFSDPANGEKSDLFVSHIILKEKWTKPKSIKDFGRFLNKLAHNNTWTEPVKIRSLSVHEADDIGPYLAPDGVTLYYSSDRTGTLGNNDIWMTRRLDDTWQNWSEPVNLGPKINTPSWDAYYCLDAKGEYAYLSSSRNSMGMSDIVKVKLAEEVRPKPVVLVSGIVYNAKTKQPIGANIEYENLADGKNAGIAVSNPSTGEYRIVLPYGLNYGFSAYSDKFISVSDNLDLTQIASYKEIQRDLYLVPLEVGSTIRLNNIFFDFGKATLRAESYPELDRLVGYMNQNDKMEIELSGHTDNVGGAEANLKLSDDRARAVTEYLVGKGIQAARIKAKGYGETKPLAGNDTEEGKQMNRRVEFTILKN